MPIELQGKQYIKYHSKNITRIIQYKYIYKAMELQNFGIVDVLKYLIRGHTTAREIN